MKKCLLPAVCFIGFLFMGCIPLSHLNTAPALPPGHFDLAAGATFIKGEGSAIGPVLGARVGIAPRVDVGLQYDTFCQYADLKIHLLTDEMAGVDFSTQIGVGTSILAVFQYFTLNISKQLDAHEPYFTYRHNYIGDNKSAEEDEPDGAGSIVFNFMNADGQLVKNLDQFFIGDAISISDRTKFIIEGMFLRGSNSEQMTAVNAGFRFFF